MLYDDPIAASARSHPPEFQAVILAGPGKDLYPLTTSTLPKALLPVGNKPIVDGVLRWAEEGGITGLLSSLCSDHCKAAS
jgi:UTP-glucose-1-phosphate uridylyltransferase